MLAFVRGGDQYDPRFAEEDKDRGDTESILEVRAKGREGFRGRVEERRQREREREGEKRQGERRKREDKERGFSVSDRADLRFFASGGREKDRARV